MADDDLTADLQAALASVRAPPRVAARLRRAVARDRRAAAARGGGGASPRPRPAPPAVPASPPRARRLAAAARENWRARTRWRCCARISATASAASWPAAARTWCSASATRAPRLMFVGEGPGHDEDLQGEPFVGRAGQLLTEIITKGDEAARARTCTSPTSSSAGRPSNRNPEADEIATCMPFLQRQIEFVRRASSSPSAPSRRRRCSASRRRSPACAASGTIPRHQGHADVSSRLPAAQPGRQAAGVGGHQAGHGGAGAAALSGAWAPSGRRRSPAPLLVAAGPRRRPRAERRPRCRAARPGGCSSPSTAASTRRPRTTLHEGLRGARASAARGADHRPRHARRAAGVDQAIVKDILGAPLPVIVYVAPSGGGATSAGVFVTLAAHVAAMAPGTNIGAAHPVGGQGETIDGDMGEKVENFAASLARTIAAAARPQRRVGGEGGARERLDHRAGGGQAAASSTSSPTDVADLLRAGERPRPSRWRDGRGQLDPGRCRGRAAARCGWGRRSSTSSPTPTSPTC